MVLREKGISAEFLSSTQTADAKNKVNYQDLDILLQIIYLAYIDMEYNLRQEWY